MNYPYFTADLHFNHRHCFENYRHLFYNTIDNMNVSIINNILSTVPKRATLYILGDIFKAEYLGLLKPNEYKIKILFGNEDVKYDNEKINGRQMIIDVLNKYNIDYEIIEDGHTICSGFVYLSHDKLPMDQINPGCINLHGHIHMGKDHPNKVPEPLYNEGGRYCNCTLDYNNFKPISLLTAYRKLGIL